VGELGVGELGVGEWVSGGVGEWELTGVDRSDGNLIKNFVAGLIVGG